VFLIAVYTIMQSFVLFFQIVFQSFEKMQYTFFTRILYALTLFVTIFIIMYHKLPIQTVASGYVIASVVTVVIAVYLMRKYFTDFFIEFDFYYWKKIMITAWPFFAGTACISVYVNVDSTFLSIFRSYREVGLYQAAYKV